MVDEIDERDEEYCIDDAKNREFFREKLLVDQTIPARSPFKTTTIKRASGRKLYRWKRLNVDASSRVVLLPL
jgi:hypothetical protein